MPYLAFFDPADLTVHYNLGALQLRVASARRQKILDEEEMSLAHDLVRNAFQTRHGLNATLQAIVDRFDSQAVMVLLTLWHEQRHYIDHLLTNFGASRVRFYSQMNMQAEGLSALFEARTIGVPLDSFVDDVDCEDLGLDLDVRFHLGGLPKMVAGRREMLETDRKIGATLSSVLPLDGYCQLEALGAVAQISALTQLFPEKLLEYQLSIDESYRKYPYFMAVAQSMQSFGIKVFDISEGESGEYFTRFYSHLFVPILIASLMCRRAQSADPNLRTSWLPAPKLRSILHQLRDDGASLAVTAREGFHMVDSACRRLWGRSIVDDLNEDLAFEESNLERFAKIGAPASVRFSRQYHECRKEMRKTLVERPEELSDPTLYFQKTVPSTYPKVVLANTSGSTWVFGRKDKADPIERKILYSLDSGIGDLLIRQIYYYDLKDEGEGRVGSARFDSNDWRAEFERARFARFLVQGRRQDPGFELGPVLVERLLKARNVNVVFWPQYEYPDPPREPTFIFEILGRDVLECEISGRQVTRQSSIVLSPWDFMRSPALREVLAKHGKLGICSADGSLSEPELGDWSEWLVHQDFSKYL